MTCVPVICVCTFSCATASAAETAWESQTHRVRISGGRVISLFDRARQAELILDQPKKIRPMFRVVLNRGLKKADEVESSQMQLTDSTTARGMLCMSFQSDQLRAVVSVGNGSEVDSLTWNIEVTPLDQQLSVAQVVFPVLHMRAPLGAESADDRIVVPYREGHLIHDPLRGVTADQRLRKAYPYPADMVGQFMGYFSDRAGCLLWTDDTEGHVKWFGFEREKDEAGLAFFVDHRMPFEPGKAWRMSYRVNTSFFDKRWQNGVDLYRAWAVKQFWCKTRFEDRRDISPILRAPCLTISSSLRQENLDTLPRRLKDYATRFDTPVVYRPQAWEKHPGDWFGIDYFPPYPSEAKFRELMATLREEGIYTIGFLSGHHWVASDDRLPEDENAAVKAFYQEHNGPTLVETLPNGEAWFSPRLRQHGRLTVRICSGTSFGRTFLVGCGRRLLDLGMTAIHDDADIGPMPCGYTCYNPSHGHPVPCGNWAAESMRDWLTEIKKAGLARSSEFFLSKEYDTELMNMILSVYQARFFHRVNGYLPGRPMEVIPVSQYLYHEYVPASFGVSGPNPHSLARLIVYGEIPSLSFWGGPLLVRPVDSMSQAPLGLLTDYYVAMKSYVKPFLLYGRMIVPPAMDVPTIRREVGLPHKKMKLTVDDPLVVTSAWQDKAGRVGVFAVNITGRPISIRCHAPTLQRRPARMSRYVGAEIVQSGESATPGTSFVWTVPPLRLCGLVFEPDG